MKLNLRQIRTAVLIISLILLSAFAGFRYGQRQNLAPSRISLDKSQPAGKQNIDLKLFWEVWDRLYTFYLDKSLLDPGQMIFGAIKGMVSSLKDPHTVFLPPDENKQTKEDLNGAFEGVGIQLDYNKDGQLVVIAPLSGLPAEKAGVRAGDLILKIEDEETSGMTIYEAVKLIRGPKGTQVKLTLLHPKENEPYELTLTRTTVVVPSVEVKFLENNLAHLKLSRFGDRTNEEWNKAVVEILERSPKIAGIIFDLRNNPGGYLDGSVFIASEFIGGGTVVQQESAKGIKKAFPVNRKGSLLTQKLVILVNQGSASASEIVAGALQDFKRAQLVGEKTFGKGTIQEAQELSGGSGLHITTARWLLPSGKSIDKSGVIPDIDIKDDPKTEKDEQFERAMAVLTQ